MTDTEILDWMQQNAISIREDINERMTVTWLDKTGIPCETEGDTMRDCVRGAAADSRSRKDVPPPRTLGTLLNEAKTRIHAG